MTVERLKWCEAMRLASLVCDEDRKDLYAHGGDPEAALEYALREDDHGGQSWLWRDGEEMLGAFGWTGAGAIWSLWSDLSAERRKQMMRVTPLFVGALVRDSGLASLGNLVWDRNRRIIAWLRASHCFEMHLDKKARIGNSFYIPFNTLPLEHLRNV